MTNNIATMPRQGATLAAGHDMLDSERMHQMMDAAKMMASARVTIPKHLQGNPGDCLAIIMQASQWSMNAFAVAQKTHLVNGQLGYEAQLVNAVVSSSSLLASRIAYEWEGDWSKCNGKTDSSEDRACTVSATLRGEHEPRTLRVSMAQVGKVRNSPLWESDPRQQLAYLATKRWARLHAPDVLLGVYTVDELHEPVERDMGTAEVVRDKQSQTRAESVRAALADKRKSKPDEPPAALDDVLQQIEAAESLESLQEAAKPAGQLVAATDKSKARAAYKARKQALEQASVPAEEFALEGQDEAAPTMTYAEVMDRMQRADSADALDEAAAMIELVEDAGQRQELADRYTDLREKMA